LGEPGFSI